MPPTKKLRIPRVAGVSAVPRIALPTASRPIVLEPHARKALPRPPIVTAM